MLNVEKPATFPDISPPSLSGANADDTIGDWQDVVLQQDCIYKHHIMRINYTTYNVRRDEDVLHTGTSHRNVMVLNPDSSPSEHPFVYACVLGIFHANVIYLGRDIMDYQAQRLEFLWVRWYKVDRHGGWDAGLLDRVHFPPINHEESFSFLDPADVLWSCHILPTFLKGKVHSDGVGRI